MKTVEQMRSGNKKEGARTASKEVRRRQLIDATIESISRHGLSGTTMTKVTGYAGLSMGIVNFHFESKDNLYLETLKFLAEEHRDQWKKEYENATKDPAAQLLAIVDADFHPKLCNRKKLTVWFAFYGEASYRKHYRQIMSEIDSERWGKIKDISLQLVKEADYENIDPEGVAKTLEGFFDGFCLNILIYPNDFSREDGKKRVREYLASIFPAHYARPEHAIIGG